MFFKSEKGDSAFASFIKHTEVMKTKDKEVFLSAVREHLKDPKDMGKYDAMTRWFSDSEDATYNKIHAPVLKALREMPNKDPINQILGQLGVAPTTTADLRNEHKGPTPV